MGDSRIVHTGKIFMAKEKEPEKEPSTERWLLSYADFITLLLVFFIIMYSMSKVNVTKYNQMVTVARKNVRR